MSTSTVAKNSGQKKTQQAVTFGVKTSQFFACFIREKKSHSSFLEIITERFPKTFIFILCKLCFIKVFPHFSLYGPWEIRMYVTCRNFNGPLIKQLYKFIAILILEDTY